MKTRFHFVLILSVCFIFISAFVEAAPESQENCDWLAADATNPILSQLKPHELNTLKTAYASNDCQLFWRDFSKNNLKNLKKFVLDLDAHGLDPSLYDVDALVADHETFDSDDEAAGRIFDVRVSSVMTRLMMDLHVGRVALKLSIPDWYYQPPYPDLAQLWRQLTDKPKFEKLLSSLLLPNQILYQKLLQERVVLLKRIEDGETWPIVKPKGQKWELGDSGEHILALKQRLIASGEFKPADKTLSDEFDEELLKAVKTYQIAHDLKDDGVVGLGTLQALNVSLPDRVKQIDVNLERIRMLPRAFPADFVFVNIPEYKATVYHKGNAKLQLRGIVGNATWRTPVFQDEMEFIVLNPTWNVPPKIAKQEMLPQVKKDPEYLSRKNFRVYKSVDGKRELVNASDVDWETASSGEYTFSQASGGGNSLGNIKFMFPNTHSVYLHDTPGRYLFDRDQRAFSHGCIRIDQPFKLAETLLGMTGVEGWTADKLKEAVQRGGGERVVKFGSKIPIYIYYLTVTLSEKGEVVFLNDIYGYDAKSAKALKLKSIIRPQAAEFQSE